MVFACLSVLFASALLRAGDPYHSSQTRTHEGIPSIEASPVSGRLWATWYASPTGGEDSNNYCVLATSADGGATWKEVCYADPDGKGPRRAFDTELWISPDGKLRWYWTERVAPLQADTGFANSGCACSAANDDLMMAVFDSEHEPAGELPPVRRIAHGIMMTKPVVAPDGAWLLPVANWNETPSSGVVRSADGGETYEVIGGAAVPEDDFEYDEHNIFFMKDDSLACWARTKSGWRRALSKDGGRTWGPMEIPAGMKHTSSRFVIKRLKSGSLMLVKHGKVDEDVGRSRLSAYVSEDDGATWIGGLMLDARECVSYPDAVETPDGLVHVVYDRDRLGRQEILYSVFTEADVRAGKDVSGKVRLSRLVTVSEATLQEAPLTGIRLRGYEGGRLGDMLANQLFKKDASYLARVYENPQARDGWRAEFWGKYMHSAVPFAAYSGSAALQSSVDASACIVRKAQQPDGYIGCYAPEFRANGEWDVWGNKYALLGLLHHYDGTGDARSLESARKLGDYLIATFGPGKRHIHKTGAWRGLASCSVLEPVVLLYKATRERRYLDFAAHIVEEMDAADGPRLFRESRVLPGDRAWDRPVHLRGARKAYEMMSCYQGLLEYYEVSGDAKCLEAARATARLIARDEITLVGSGGSDEIWYHGVRRQAECFSRPQETCIVTTWMRLCEKLLALTADPFWADEIEKSFYNAYLAALRRDGGSFAAYTPLCGTRSEGHNHCNMHTDCCNENGPRGFLAFLSSYLMTSPGRVYMNWFASSDTAAKLPDGTEVKFETYTLYPADGKVVVTCRSDRPAAYALCLRIPAWSAATKVEVNGEAAAGVRAGEYLSLWRTWKAGDKVTVAFDMTCRLHRIGLEAVAFTAGPIVLARDSRFGDGDLSERTRYYEAEFDAPPAARRVQCESPDMRVVYDIALPIGDHAECPSRMPPRTVRFCDFASAGNDWRTDGFYRVWLPVLLRPIHEEDFAASQTQAENTVERTTGKDKQR